MTKARLILVARMAYRVYWEGARSQRRMVLLLDYQRGPWQRLAEFEYTCLKKNEALYIERLYEKTAYWGNHSAVIRLSNGQQENWS
jgi:hypothetical protein